MILRPYQEKAIAALYKYLREHDDNPIVVIPTGGGKTPVMATICHDAVTRWSGRVIILAHRKELLEQSCDKLRAICPDVSFGVYSAGLRRRDTKESVLVCGIQSTYRRATELGRCDLILVDEAHRIPPDGVGMYRQFLSEATVVNPHVRVVGLTATPYRMGSGLIYGEGQIFSGLCYEVGVRELIVDGHLSNLISKTGKSESIADTSGVHTRGGEFVADELEEVMIKASVVKSAVREIVKHAEGRQRVLIFACGVKHAEAVRLEVQRQTSENCDFVCGETPYMFRDEVLRRFQSPSGDLKYLVNVNILAEGFDAPGIDCIALMRATKSPGLYYQMVGRGLRTCEAKESCLVLDYGENIIRHGPIDRVRPKREKSGDGSGDAPTKFCPQCQTAVILASAACPECGYEWPVPEPTHNASASGAGILSSQHHLEWHRVKHVCYGSYSKRGAPEDHPKTLRVDYDIGCYRMISEWVCVEHPEGSFAHERAALWWSERTREAMPPTAAEAAVVARSQSEFKQPSEIEVCTKAEERWPEISNHRFDGDIRQDEYFTRITGEWHEAEEVPF